MFILADKNVVYKVSDVLSFIYVLPPTSSASFAVKGRSAYSALLLQALFSSGLLTGKTQRHTNTLAGPSVVRSADRLHTEPALIPRAVNTECQPQPSAWARGYHHALPHTHANRHSHSETQRRVIKLSVRWVEKRLICLQQPNMRPAANDPRPGKQT